MYCEGHVWLEKKWNKRLSINKCLQHKTKVYKKQMKDKVLMNENYLNYHFFMWCKIGEREKKLIQKKSGPTLHTKFILLLLCWLFFFLYYLRSCRYEQTKTFSSYLSNVVWNASMLSQPIENIFKALRR